jgi:hypothetical protein
MNDNHTFVELTGTPEEMAQQANRACTEYGGGMLAPPRWVDVETKAERSTKVQPVHDNHGYLNPKEIERWIREVAAEIRAQKGSDDA